MGGKPGLIKYNSANKDFKAVPAFSGIIPKAIVMDIKVYYGLVPVKGLMHSEMILLF